MRQSTIRIGEAIQARVLVPATVVSAGGGASALCPAVPAGAPGSGIIMARCAIAIGPQWKRPSREMVRFDGHLNQCCAKIAPRSNRGRQRGECYVRKDASNPVESRQSRYPVEPNLLLSEGSRMHDPCQIQLA